MDLTVGPNPYFWSIEAVREFYAALADAPVERVVLGEWVCSKRLPFWQDAITDAAEVLLGAGKQVALSTLALITLPRERRQCAELTQTGLPIEINDLTALTYLPEGARFWVGPMVNVYNEGTLGWLAGRGAERVCLPPELPLGSVRRLAAAGRALGVAIEVWGHGRLPLAISGRCYHARLHARSKDSCQFVCVEDPDGRAVATIDEQPFLAVNGVQTLSHSTATAALKIPALREAGVTALRLSPQSRHFAEICAGYAAVLHGATRGQEWADALQSLVPGGALSDGFADGPSGAHWSGGPPA
ncbi:MAG: U32 family peptidase [Pararhodobacter sp.]